MTNKHLRSSGSQRQQPQKAQKEEEEGSDRRTCMAGTLTLLLFSNDLEFLGFRTSDTEDLEEHQRETLYIDSKSKEK